MDAYWKYTEDANTKTRDYIDCSEIKKKEKVVLCGRTLFPLDIISDDKRSQQKSHL